MNITQAVKTILTEYQWITKPWTDFRITSIEAIEIGLGTIGLTWILTRSKLFMKFRSSLSMEYNQNQESKFLWFMNSIFGCHGCMGFWSAGANLIAVVYGFNFLPICWGGSFLSLLAINHIMWQERR